MNETAQRQFFTDMDALYTTYTTPAEDSGEQVNGFHVILAVLEHTKQVLLNSVVQGQQLEVLSIIAHSAEALEGAQQRLARITLQPPAEAAEPETEFSKAQKKRTRKAR